MLSSVGINIKYLGDFLAYPLLEISNTGKEYLFNLYSEIGIYPLFNFHHGFILLIYNNYSQLL